jgi:hypothetical protein
VLCSIISFHVSTFTSALMDFYDLIFSLISVYGLCCSKEVVAVKLSENPKNKYLFT